MIPVVADRDTHRGRVFCYRLGLRAENRRDTVVATLAELEEQKRELEDRLEAGDLSVEAGLARIDRAISARRQTIQHSRKRLGAAHDAVAAGMSVDEARKPKKRVSSKATKKTARSLNRFE